MPKSYLTKHETLASVSWLGWPQYLGRVEVCDEHGYWLRIIIQHAKVPDTTVPKSDLIKHETLASVSWLGWP
jgi:hypothetical protein